MEAALSPKPRKAAASGASTAEDGGGAFGLLASMVAGEGGMSAGAVGGAVMTVVSLA
jgi:hypothetical protein